MTHRYRTLLPCVSLVLLASLHLELARCQEGEEVHLPQGRRKQLRALDGLFNHASEDIRAEVPEKGDLPRPGELRNLWRILRIWLSEGRHGKACMKGLIQSGFDIFDTGNYGQWLNEESVMELAQTGQYVGPEDIAEYVDFISADFFSVYNDEEARDWQFFPVSFTEDVCVLHTVGTNRAEVNPALGKGGCVRTTISYKLFFTVGEKFNIHRINLFYSPVFLEFLFSDLLNTDGVRDYICHVMQSDCAETFAHNNLTDQESCRSAYDALDVTDSSGSLDGDTKGCRILHSAFASVNERHCPHISFEPQQDYLGREKCQVSEGTDPSTLFSDEEMRNIYRVAEENGYPLDTLYKLC